MPLPDPELELLREMLHEDPGNEAFLLVGRELVSRSQWDAALGVLDAGLEAADTAPDEAWALLAEAALKGGRVLRALSALEHVPTDPATHETAARLRVLALEAAGKIAEAKEAAEDFLDHHPQDVVVDAVVERLTAPPPDRSRRLADPMISVEQAERYVAIDRPDRAVRVLRRLFFHFPDDLGFSHRIAALQGLDSPPLDDLSEEIDLADGVPPGLSMPTPGLGIAPDPSLSDLPTMDDDDELTDPMIGFDLDEIRRQIAERKAEAIETPPPQEEDEEDTEPFVYGKEFDGRHPDDEETVMLPEGATNASQEEIERRIREVREKRKRRSLLQNN